MWPWWIVPVYFGLKFLALVTWPINAPLMHFCHADLFGNGPEPQSRCPSYWCPKIAREHPELWSNWQADCGDIQQWK
jgi:hypothetical protein